MAGRNDVDSSRRLRSQHHRECQCAVDLASLSMAATEVTENAASMKKRPIPSVATTDDPANLRGVRMTSQMGAVALRLELKDEEIDQTRRDKDALAQRLRGELLAWRNAAVAFEAENAALRGELDHALQAMARPDDDDAESCCYGENFTGSGKEEDEGGGPSTAGRCFGCGERACWHLCAAAWACPACGYGNLNNVHVNHLM